VVIDKILASDNLNECVDLLLRKEKADYKNSLALNPSLRVIRHNASGKLKEKKKRQRKNLDQHHLLLERFEKDPNWDKATMLALGKELGLKESQIYKWNWDMRKKQGLLVLPSS
jgi:hypothetical protein